MQLLADIHVGNEMPIVVCCCFCFYFVCFLANFNIQYSNRFTFLEVLLLLEHLAGLLDHAAVAQLAQLNGGRACDALFHQLFQDAY